MKVIGVTWVDQGMRVALPWGRGLPECVPPAGYWLQETKDGVQILKGQAVLMKLCGVIGVIHYGPDDDAAAAGAGKAPPAAKLP